MPEQGEIITYIDIYDSVSTLYIHFTVILTNCIHCQMHFEMDIEVHSFPNSGWANIMHCGDSANSPISFPGVFIHSDAGTDGESLEGFAITWNTVDNDYNKNHTDYLTIGESYHLDIDVTQGWMKFQLNGEIAYSEAKSRHFTPNNVPCWTSDPSWDAADVTVSNFRVYSGINN